MSLFDGLRLRLLCLVLRVVPRLPMRARIRRTAWGLLAPRRDHAEVPTPGGWMRVPLVDRSFARSMTCQGAYEIRETEWLRRTIKLGWVVVDGGAHIGFHVLVAAAAAGAMGAVWAFEPSPDNAALARANAELNGFDQVHVIQKALADQAGEKTFFLHPQSSGGHSFGEENAGGAPTPLTVETTTLDDVWEEVRAAGAERIDLIKLDVQGAEGLIVKGGLKLLREQAPLTLMEFSPRHLRAVGTDPEGLLRELEQMGFRFRLITPAVDGLLDAAEAWDAAGRAHHLNLVLEKAA